VRWSSFETDSWRLPADAGWSPSIPLREEAEGLKTISSSQLMHSSSEARYLSIVTLKIPRMYDSIRHHSCDISILANI
jgi:hypothetical protein